MRSAVRTRPGDVTTPVRRGEVRAEAIRLAYGGVTALDEVDLHVEAGEFFTLLGPSGSGKTTLLRLIGGLLEPGSGRIHLDGQDVTGLPPQKRDIGFVFQNYALFPHLTVAENIEFGLRVRKIDPAARRRRVTEILELVALGGFGDRHPGELSGGQQQRVALGRALAQRPRVLLLDEPLGALDRRLRQELGAEVRRIQQEAETTAIYVTHDQDEAFLLSDRMAVMDAGAIRQTGTPEALYRRPADRFVARFLGETNLFDGHLVDGGPDTVVAVGGGTVVCLPPDSAITSGAVHCAVRPEQMVIVEAGTVPPPGLGVLGPAEVTASRFLGQRHAITLRAGERVYHAAVDPAGEHPLVGDRVQMCVRDGQAAVVPHGDRSTGRTDRDASHAD